MKEHKFYLYFTRTLLLGLSTIVDVTQPVVTTEVVSSRWVKEDAAPETS